jgi:hypothetical protein
MSSSRPKSVSLWWLYFFFCAASILLGLLVGQRTLEDVLYSLLIAVELVPIYGYVKQRPIGPRLLWVAVAALAFASQIGDLLWAVVVAAQEGPLSDLWLFFLVPVVIAPSLWAAFAYAFRSPHLWAQRGVHA